MKKITSVFLMGGLWLASLSAIAAPVWKSATTIQGIQAGADGSFILALPAGSDPVCTNGGVFFYVAPGQNGVTPEGARVILSVALLAYASGKQIHLLYDNSTQACYVQTLHLTNT